MFIQTPLVVPEQPAGEVVRLGDCRGAAGPIDLGRLLWLENRVVSSGSRRLSLRGETVQIGAHDGAPADHQIVDVGRLVSPDADIDIMLKFGLLDGDPVIFWRETFQHRRFRQGLFRMDGDNLTPVCTGTGGVDSSH